MELAKRRRLTYFTLPTARRNAATSRSFPFGQVLFLSTREDVVWTLSDSHIYTCFVAAAKLVFQWLACRQVILNWELGCHKHLKFSTCKTVNWRISRFVKLKLKFHYVTCCSVLSAKIIDQHIFIYRSMVNCKNYIIIYSWKQIYIIQFK